jgi:hypothetical protein
VGVLAAASPEASSGIIAVEDGDESTKIFVKPENESAFDYYEIWPFGRLHTSRFC